MASKASFTQAPGGAASLRLRLLSRSVFLAGLACLSFLLGAGVMFFNLPSADVLAKTFAGARAWSQEHQAASQAAPRGAAASPAADVDRPDKTFDGFTLFATVEMGGSNTDVFLMNMRRQVVHRWSAPFSRVWPNPPQVRGPAPDYLACVYGTHLYPNGDLLVVYHGLGQLATGYGLAKLDKDSNVLWGYAANVHHDVDVGEDGTIYAIQHEVVETMPEGLGFVPTPCLADSLAVLSPDGKPVRKPVSILEAFRDSPYAALLDSLRPADHDDPEADEVTGPHFDDAVRRQDALHTNCAQVLSSRLAPKFPLWKAGQVLISCRHLSTLAVLDLEKRSVVWAARGPWQGQHDPQFLDAGRLLLFDNRGLPTGSRVLEYDPQTQAIPWSYAGENWRPFYSSERGMSQRLPNGNTLVVNSEGGEMLEVTPDKQVVWTCSLGRFITTARRYAPDEVPFLKRDQHARP